MTTAPLFKRWATWAAILSFLSLTVLCTTPVEEEEPDTTDKDPATVSITTPSQDTTVSNAVSSFRVVGAVTDDDDVGVDSLKINGTSYYDSLNTSNLTFAVTLDLSEGENAITVRMRDIEGNVDVDSVSITRRSSPAVTITTADSVANTDTTIRISGTLSHPDSIAYDSLLINDADYSDSMSATVDTSGDSVTTFGVTVSLPSDTDTVTYVIRVVDANGGASEDTLVVGKYVAPQTGLAKISGTLTQEAPGGSGKRRRLVTTTGGQKVMVDSTVPVSGADILVYDGNSSSTASVAQAQSDSLGQWEVDSLDPGNYFIFAVYFDFATRSLKTAAIPDVEAVADSEATTQEAVVTEDEIEPNVVAMLDATSGDSTGLYLASAVPAGTPALPITFSEPMDRGTAGDSVTVIILGRVDTSASSFRLADTIPVTKKWNGNGTELRLIPQTALEDSVGYGIRVSVQIKDLAFNALESSAKVSFTTIPVDSMPPFVFTGSTPKDGDTVMPMTPIFVTFNRAPDINSVKSNLSITPEISGYWDARGTKIVYVPDTLLDSGDYTIEINSSLVSIVSEDDSLGADTSFTFTVEALQSDIGTGDTAALSQVVLRMINAYDAGDMVSFGSVLHPDMKMIENWEWSDGQGNTESGTEIISKENMLRHMREEAAFDQQVASEGVLFPIFYLTGDSTNLLHKVLPVDGSGDCIYKEAWGMGAFGQPMFYDCANRNHISDQSQFTFMPGRPEVEYNGEHYIFDADFSKLGPVSESRVEDDKMFFGKLLEETSTIECGRAFLEGEEDISIQKVEISGDTGYVIMSIAGYEYWHGDTRPWPYVAGVNLSNLPGQFGFEPDTSSWVEIMKMKCVKKSGQWMIYRMIQEDVWEDNNSTVINTDTLAGMTFAFGADDFTMPPAITMLSPVENVDNAVETDGGIVLKWTAPDLDTTDTLGGYLVAIAEDPGFTPCRPPKGKLMYVRSAADTVQVKLRADGKIDTTGGISAVAINRRPGEVNAHQMFWFEWALDTIESYNVFEWKVIAVTDTSARQIIANNSIGDILAESDFVGIRGRFAVAEFPDRATIDELCAEQGPMDPNMNNFGFEDDDGDGYPNGEEQRWGTDPQNGSDWPNFGVDSDGDKYPDFLEERFGTSVDDPAEYPAADSTDSDGVRFGDIGYVDSDGDGYPDEIEGMMGTNMFDPMDNAGTRVAFEAPIGSFEGKMFFSGESKSITVKAMRDSSSDAQSKPENLRFMVIFETNASVFIDSVDTVPARFDKFSGELAFKMPFDTTGPEAGKALILRGFYDAMQGRLGGPIDIIRATDDLYAGGPWAGDWGTSNRGEEITEMFNQPNDPMMMDPGNMELPQPPPDADSVWFFTEYNDDSGKVIAKLVYKDRATDTLNAVEVFKGCQLQDMCFHEMTFVKTTTGNRMHINGDMFHSRIKGDTVAYSGGIWVEDSTYMPLPFGGGFTFLKKDTMPQDWEGWYRGWVFVDTSMSGGMDMGFGGPPEFTGGIDAFRVQLDSIRPGIQQGDSFYVAFPWNIEEGSLVPYNIGSTVLPVDSLPRYDFLHEGCVFVILDPENDGMMDTLLVFGSPDDRNIIDAQPIFSRGEDTLAVIAEYPPPPFDEKMSGMNMRPPLRAYAGPLDSAKEVFRAANHEAKMVREWDNYVEIVDVRTDAAYLDTALDARVRVVVPDYRDDARLYILLAEEGDSLTPYREEDRPVVREMELNTVTSTDMPPFYDGGRWQIEDQWGVDWHVKVITPDTQFIAGVNTNTLVEVHDDMVGHRVWIVEDPQNGHTYVYLGRKMNPGMLLTEDNFAVVTFTDLQAPQFTGPQLYQGDDLRLKSALTLSNNEVKVMDDNMRIQAVDRTTLTEGIDPDKGNSFFTIVGTDDSTYIFMAPGDDMNIPMKNGDHPVVIMEGGGGMVDRPPLADYMGPVADAQTVLDAANGELWIIDDFGNLMDIHVGTVTVEPMADPNNRMDTLSVITNNDGPSYIFLAPDSNVMQVYVEDGKAVCAAVDMNTGPQATVYNGPMGDITNALNMSDDMAVIQDSLGNLTAETVKVDQATLEAGYDDSSGMLEYYTIEDTGTTRVFLLKCVPDAPNLLWIDNGKPVVEQVGSAHRFFTGDSAAINTVLDAQGDSVSYWDDATQAEVNVPVVRDAVVWYSDGSDSAWVIFDQAGAQPSFVFLADDREGTTLAVATSGFPACWKPD